MPPSPVNRREKVPRVPDHKRSAREQQRLPLLQGHRSWWNHLPLLQNPKYNKYHLLPSHRKNQPQPEEPQPEETSADVHEQTADPAILIIASAVSPIQTSTDLLKVTYFLFIADEPTFHFIITSVNLSADSLIGNSS